MTAPDRHYCTDAELCPVCELCGGCCRGHTATCRHCTQRITTLTGQPGRWTDGNGFEGCIKAQSVTPASAPNLPGRPLFSAPVLHEPMPAGLAGAPE